MEYLLKHSEAPTNQQFLNEVAKKIKDLKELLYVPQSEIYLETTTEA